ncbi:nucleoside kinase [Gabonibacter chumensis]|uniref:nucleoside kinase n=1 Tax=Gabonibacter chumensis TaxID=2972474 RepID=UPI0025742877|nr:nucleoside kinase [Gabonibacter chumensis]MCR9011773.1 nucleoside kinase [Gabonibacter chumensis]
MEKNKITIYCENNKQEYIIPTGCSLKELKQTVFPQNHQNILGALVNNELQDLHYEIYNPKWINFIDVTSLDGYSIYIRSLIFVLYKAVKTLFPKKTLIVEYSISNGLFCRIANKDLVLTPETILSLKEEMTRIIEQNTEIIRRETPTEEAIKLFQREGLKDKKLLLSTRGKMYTSVYSINGTSDYFYGTLAPTTGCLKVFDLISYKDGMLLMLPDRNNPTEISPFIPQEKLFNIFSEYKRWGKILEVSQIGDLNQIIEKKQVGAMIKISEALHEKKISQIADLVKKKHKKVKVILIAGPSSSGKTTFGKRLAVQLMVNGIKPVNLSLDNYFVDRENTPRDEKGEYDFETIDALDIDTFNDNILQLLQGNEVEIPKFSFETGQRFYDGEKLRISKNNVIIVEGIHGLNPRLTEFLPQENLFKIFISALTSISIDNHNIINPKDNRLIRRMVRDHKYRGYSAWDTLKRWESVLSGEQKHIEPYQEEADIIFNSALVYELGALKQQAVPLLEEVLTKYPEHSKALRLLKFFSYVQSVPTREIPPTSIIREFLGGSSFKY